MGEAPWTRIGVGPWVPLCPPRLAGEVDTRRHAAEDRGLPSDFLMPCRPDGHVAVDRVIQAADGLTDSGGVDDVGHGLVRRLPEE